MRSVHRSILDAVLHMDPSPTTLLDVGCGDGWFTLILSSNLPGTQMIAFDRTRHSSLRESVDIRFVAGSVDALPFSDRSFDMVVASLSLHHWEDKESGIAELSRVLQTGGSLILGDPLRQGWLGNRVLGQLAQRIDGGIFSIPDELTASLESNGFESVRISTVPHSFRSLFLITARKRYDTG